MTNKYSKIYNQFKTKKTSKWPKAKVSNNYKTIIKLYNKLILKIKIQIQRVKGLKVNNKDKMLNRHRGMFRVDKFKTKLKISILEPVKRHMAKTGSMIRRDWTTNSLRESKRVSSLGRNNSSISQKNNKKIEMSFKNFNIMTTNLKNWCNNSTRMMKKMSKTRRNGHK